MTRVGARLAMSTVSSKARSRCRRAYAKEGGLLGYGPDYNDLFRRSASYVDRILKGEKPSNLPVQIPKKFELVINLKTAKSLGLIVSPTLLTRADEVIE